MCNEKFTQNCCLKTLRGRKHLRELGVDGRVILKWNLCNSGRIQLAGSRVLWRFFNIVIFWGGGDFVKGGISLAILGNNLLLSRTLVHLVTFQERLDCV
jgi:hypothetical protein